MFIDIDSTSCIIREFKGKILIDFKRDYYELSHVLDQILTPSQRDIAYYFDRKFKLSKKKQIILTDLMKKYNK